MLYHVEADWDAEAGVWVAASDDVPGLVAEAATLEGLRDDIRALVPKLLALNGAGGVGCPTRSPAATGGDRRRRQPG